VYVRCGSQPGRIAGQLHSSNSDVWSLGLTIMECALGYYPYRPPSKEKEVLHYTINSKAIPPQVETMAPKLTAQNVSTCLTRWCSSLTCTTPSSTTSRPLCPPISTPKNSATLSLPGTLHQALALPQQPQVQLTHCHVQPV
jgi:serine/threonine protein kinase